MKFKCDYHGKKHDDTNWRTYFPSGGKLYTICSEGMNPPSPSSVGPTLGVSATGKRLSHWGDIKSRVTTHEGEMLTGAKGRDYQKKYSKQYLGKDMSAPSQFNTQAHLQELSKRK